MQWWFYLHFLILASLSSFFYLLFIFCEDFPPSLCLMSSIEGDHICNCTGKASIRRRKPSHSSFSHSPLLPFILRLCHYFHFPPQSAVCCSDTGKGKFYSHFDLNQILKCVSIITCNCCLLLESMEEKKKSIQSNFKSLLPFSLESILDSNHMLNWADWVI